MEYYSLVKQYVDKEFERAGRAHHELSHFERTVHWLKVLKPDADEAMLIAAYAHDIERAFRDKSDEELKHIDFKHEFYTKQHPEKGAEIVGNFLADNKVPDDLIAKVKMLIARHEIGGTDEQNLIKDADSISFLEDQGKIDRFIARMADRGTELIRRKFDWMFQRITSPKAKELAKPFYEQAMSKI